MAKTYVLAEVKFNGGRGACLCNGCSVILSYGIDHEDTKRYCESCVNNLKNVIKSLTHKLEKIKSPLDRDPNERLNNGG